MFSQTDLYVAARDSARRQQRLQLSLNVLNLFNQDAAVSKFSTYQRDDGVALDEARSTRVADARLPSSSRSRRIQQDPRFLMDNGFQAPLHGAVRREVPLLGRTLKQLYLGPAGHGPRGFFPFEDGGVDAHRTRVAATIVALTIWLGSPQTSTDRERAKPTSDGLGHSCGNEAWPEAAKSFQQAIDIDRSSRTPTTASGSPACG